MFPCGFGVWSNGVWSTLFLIRVSYQCWISLINSQLPQNILGPVLTVLCFYTYKYLQALFETSFDSFLNFLATCPEKTLFTNVPNVVSCNVDMFLFTALSLNKSAAVWIGMQPLESMTNKSSMSLICSLYRRCRKKLTIDTSLSFLFNLKTIWTRCIYGYKSKGADPSCSADFSS